ncbi:NADH:ubiquinone oxidoreductase 20.1kD subunit [Arthroderma uncinatum]|uniref:NADH:ubiquinone oxidoreductase 20.1kD subunit n=1 Tax=Arthroderma uncinatum TaxID=74035 RepID=UPI00144ACA72|nr:NADH:ubiquinone oxidoreductase 20.1kD subunit [Arthroderma uncinatum]KAF3492217.1 NADH:ubiquinone oxidoreductase 20.1kD subunit [Arthroderma uncinatum]
MSHQSIDLFLPRPHTKSGIVIGKGARREGKSCRRRDTTRNSKEKTRQDKREKDTAAAIMLSRRILSRVPARIPTARITTQVRYASQAEIQDPGMNGGYENPPAVKRQFRDPNADWWDAQDKRNFGEPVHEDNDILTTFSAEEYTHFKAPKAFFLLGCSVVSVFAFSGVVSLFYPDKPSAPRTFPDGLEAELGGPNAVVARKPHEDSW